MNEFFAAGFTFAVGSGVLFAAAAGALLLRPDRLPRVEPLPRNRWIGLFLGWAALILCIPHARAVSFDFLLPFLWPLALATPVLSFFYLDYIAARAVGGLMILYAYYAVHFGFEQHLAPTPLFAWSAWLVGAAGIWISGKPCALRDWLRACARSFRWRLASAAALGICGALSLLGFAAVLLAWRS